MATSKKNKGVKLKKGNSLLFIRKKDKRGNSYFIDRSGKRVSKLFYLAQFSSKGRNTKEGTEQTVKLIKQQKNKGKKITEKDVKRISEKYYQISAEIKASERKKEERLLPEFPVYWSLRENILELKKIGYKFYLKLPGYSGFKLTDGGRVLEYIENFVEAVNREVKDFNEKAKGDVYINPQGIVTETQEGNKIMKIDLSDFEALSVNNVDENQVFEFKQNVLERFKLLKEEDFPIMETAKKKKPVKKKKSVKKKNRKK